LALLGIPEAAIFRGGVILDFKLLWVHPVSLTSTPGVSAAPSFLRENSVGYVEFYWEGPVLSRALLFYLSASANLDT